MSILAGILGGLICGMALAIAVTLLANFSYLGWLDPAVMPAFYVGSVVFALIIGLKAEKLGL